MTENNGDLQILEEVVLNERIVTHPKLGKIRLRMPTLDIQKKIEAVARSKRKMLKDAKDTVVDELGHKTIVPAYKSREQLERDYAELGWWTEAEKTKLADLSEQHIKLLAELENLGFESDAKIYLTIGQIKAELETLCKDEKGDVPPEVMEVLNIITIPGATLNPSITNVLRDHSNSTKVDDFLGVLDNLHKQYKTYLELAKIYSSLLGLQSQQASLFSDSWQEQLQYYIRLAQVFYCTEKVETPPVTIWPSLEAIEKEQDISLVRWIFGELNAFWQGISDETREKMDKYSFTNPRGTAPSSTEDSPAPQESLVDGELQVKEPTSSIKATDIPVL